MKNQKYLPCIVSNCIKHIMHLVSSTQNVHYNLQIQYIDIKNFKIVTQQDDNTQMSHKKLW